MISINTVNGWLTFSPFLNCGIQIWKLGSDFWEPDLNFKWLVTTPTSVLVLLIARFTLVELLSRMIIPEKNGYARKHFCSTIRTFSERHISFPLNKTSSLKKTFLTILQFFQLLLQWIQILHSLDFVPNICSDTSNSTSDKSFHSEEVS